MLHRHLRPLLPLLLVVTACDDPSTLSIDLAPVDPALADDEIPEKPDAALVADALEAGLLDDEAEAGAIAALGLDLAAPARPSAIALQAGDRFGFATAFGDFDGDGDLELAVSAIHKATGTIPDVGAVQLYEYTGYYVSTLQETYTLTQPGLTEPQPYEKFGYALAVGDYDGDGDDDLAVGTPDDDNRGAVFVFLGGSGGLTYAGKLTAASVPGESRHVYHWFGAALAAGDFNNDGRDELVVGAPSWTDEPGAAYLFRGTASGLVGATALREGAIDAVEPPCYGICFFPPTLGVLAPGTSFGAALAAGDLDGDDIDDLIVGAPGANASNGEPSGRAYAFKGDPNGQFGGSVNAPLVGWGTLEQTLWTNEDGDEFGRSVAIVDADADGVREALIGAPGEDSDSGAVFVFRSEITPLCVGCVHTIKAKSAWTQGTVGQATIEAGDRFGASLAGVRSSAVMVGSPGEAPGSSPAGGMATHMDDGGLWAHLTEQSPWGAGIVASDEFGFGVSTAIDPWGFDVIAVSAHDYGQKASNGYGTGAVFLVERHPNGNYGATHTLP